MWVQKVKLKLTVSISKYGLSFIKNKSKCVDRVIEQILTPLKAKNLKHLPYKNFIICQ